MEPHCPIRSRKRRMGCDLISELSRDSANEAEALRLLGAFLRHVEQEPERFPTLSRYLRERGALAAMAYQEATAAFAFRPAVLCDFDDFERALKAQAVPSEAIDWTSGRIDSMLRMLEDAGMGGLAQSLHPLVGGGVSRSVGFPR